MKKLKWLNVALRGIMEIGIIIGFGYWGYHTGDTKSLKIILAISTPLIGFGFWGTIDFRNFGRISEPLRLCQELIISGLAGTALIVSGAIIFGWLLIALSIVHHSLIYLTGESLLNK